MATEQDIEDTDAVISDNDTSTVFPDGTPAGDFDASGNPYDNPYQLHRPHAFALMHGDGGAKISYGQLIFRIDQINLSYKENSDGTLLADDIDTDTWPSGTVGATYPTHPGVTPQTNAAHQQGLSGQDAIEGLNIKVPTIDTEDGKEMSANINDIDEDGIPTGLKYHQLNGYGDVYLYWKVDLDDAARVTKCWVTVDGTTAEDDVDAVPIGHSAVNRLVATSSTNHVGTYRVKLGTVNDGTPIHQNISSDVHWSITLLARVVETGS